MRKWMDGRSCRSRRLDTRSRSPADRLLAFAKGGGRRRDLRMQRAARMIKGTPKRGENPARRSTVIRPCGRRDELEGVNEVELQINDRGVELRLVGWAHRTVGE